MTDQEKLDFKEKYKNNPIAFIEDFYSIKLLPYQKVILNAINRIGNRQEYFIQSRINQKKWLANLQLEYMKVMKMDFQIWKPDGIEVYEKGVLVKTIKHKE